jgi:hypothetical protein
MPEEAEEFTRVQRRVDGPERQRATVHMAPANAVVRIAWYNPKHELLSHHVTRSSAPDLVAEIRVFDRSTDTEILPRGSVVATDRQGHLDFPIPSGASNLEILCSFSPCYHPTNNDTGAADTSSVVARTVFAAQFQLRRQGTTFVHDGTQETVQTIKGRHPLVSMPGQVASASVLPTTSFILQTEFVDATDLLRALGTDDSLFTGRTHWRFSGDLWTSIRILGYTGASVSFLCAAFIPWAASAQKAKDVQALMFYCPRGFLYTSSIAQTRDSNAGKLRKPSLGRLARYMMSADREAPRDEHEFWPFVHYAHVAGAKRLFPYINVGLGGSVDRSGKRVLLLVPFPHAHDHGPFTHAGLAKKVEKAALLLWTKLNFAKDSSEPPSQGRLGLAAFSNGGGALRQAFQNNNSDVNEVYSFDSNDYPMLWNSIRPWLAGGLDRRFAVIAGLQNVTAGACRVASLSYPAQVYAHPTVDDFWSPRSSPNLGRFWLGSFEPATHELSTNNALKMIQQNHMLTGKERDLILERKGDLFPVLAHQFAATGFVDLQVGFESYLENVLRNSLFQ